MNESLRRSIGTRSRGRCEAFIQLQTGYPARCSQPATDIHHLLTKARGGRALDRAGEIYHLIHLCRECHQAADGAEAYKYGLLIEGSAIWSNILGRPIYTGPDSYLSNTYKDESYVS